MLPDVSRRWLYIWISDVPQLNKRTPLVVSQEKYDEADPLYLRAIEIGEKTLGPDHPALARSKSGCPSAMA